MLRAYRARRPRTAPVSSEAGVSGPVQHACAGQASTPVCQQAQHAAGPRRACSTCIRKRPYTSSPRLPTGAARRPSRAAANRRLQLPPTSHASAAGARRIRRRSSASLFTSAGGGSCARGESISTRKQNALLVACLIAATSAATHPCQAGWRRRGAQTTAAGAADASPVQAAALTRPPCSSARTHTLSGAAAQGGGPQSIEPGRHWQSRLPAHPATSACTPRAAPSAPHRAAHRVHRHDDVDAQVAERDDVPALAPAPAPVAAARRRPARLMRQAHGSEAQGPGPPYAALPLPAPASGERGELHPSCTGHTAPLACCRPPVRRRRRGKAWHRAAPGRQVPD